MTSLEPPKFLTESLCRYTAQPVLETRPFVTLTFAQSLDAKIAGAFGEQLILSGKESMIMTHWMRTMHDAILIGIGTALNDDPQLNVRHLPPLPDGAKHKLPRPIIVDSRLRLAPSCKLLTNYQNGLGRRPWIICADTNTDAEWRKRLRTLEDSGAKVIRIPNQQGQQLSVRTILLTLRNHGVSTLMVEGGASIIESFIAESKFSEAVIDSLVVTVAPILVGAQGIGYSVPLTNHNLKSMKYTRTEAVGNDTVVMFMIEPATHVP